MSEVIIPVQQDTVDFDSYPVLGVRLPDGRVGASLRDICDAMKIDRPSQVQRIRGDETIADCLVSVQIQTRGGPQVADILTAWAIPYWLTGVELARIRDEKKRQAILLFKRNAADVLYQHFAQRQALPEPSLTVTPVQPSQPAQDADALTWAEYHQQMAAFYRWKAATDSRIDTLEGWQDTVEARLESHEQVLELIPEILERLGPLTLTPAHQSLVQYYVNQLHEATSKTHASIQNNLRLAFNVPSYKDIPESEWGKVVNWFRVQMERVHKKLREQAPQPSLFDDPEAQS